MRLMSIAEGLEKDPIKRKQIRKEEDLKEIRIILKIIIIAIKSSIIGYFIETIITSFIAGKWGILLSSFLGAII